MSDADGSPVIGTGEVVWGQREKLTRPRAGIAVVLTGRSGGYREVTPDTPMSVWESWRGRYTNYVEVDTSERALRRTESIRSGDPSFAFLATIEIKARVQNADVFLQNYGTTASIFSPFYNELMRDVHHFASRFHPDQIGLADAELAQLAQRFESSQPVYGGVRITSVRVTLSHDKEFVNQSMAAQAAMLHQKYGPEGIAVLKLANPQHATSLQAFSDDLVRIAKQSAALNKDEWDEAVSRVERLVNAGIIDREEGRQFLQMDQLRDLARLNTKKGDLQISGPDGPSRLIPRPTEPQATRRLPSSPTEKS